MFERTILVSFSLFVTISFSGCVARSIYEQSDLRSEIYSWYAGKSLRPGNKLDGLVAMEKCIDRRENVDITERAEHAAGSVIIGTSGREDEDSLITDISIRLARTIRRNSGYQGVVFPAARERFPDWDGLWISCEVRSWKSILDFFYPTILLPIPTGRQRIDLSVSLAVENRQIKNEPIRPLVFKIQRERTLWGFPIFFFQYETGSEPYGYYIDAVSEMMGDVVTGLSK